MIHGGGGRGGGGSDSLGKQGSGSLGAAPGAGADGHAGVGDRSRAGPQGGSSPGERKGDGLEQGGAGEGRRGRPRSRHYVCQAAYGFLGDVMCLSEGLRFMGPSRWAHAGQGRCASLCVCLRACMCRLCVFFVCWRDGGGEGGLRVFLLVCACVCMSACMQSSSCACRRVRVCFSVERGRAFLFAQAVIGKNGHDAFGALQVRGGQRRAWTGHAFGLLVPTCRGQRTVCTRHVSGLLVRACRDQRRVWAGHVFGVHVRTCRDQKAWAGHVFCLLVHTCRYDLAGFLQLVKLQSYRLQVWLTGRVLWPRPMACCSALPAHHGVQFCVV